jgi:hypothetical protein
MAEYKEGLDVIDALQAEHSRLAHLNGQLRMAQKVQDWVLRNRDQLPPWVIEELSILIAATYETGDDAAG